jgi:hypothetical protein
MTPEPKSAEDAAADEYWISVDADDNNSHSGTQMRESFLAGVTWQKEREALLVEALEFIAGPSDMLGDVAPAECEPLMNRARAALLKYRGSL